MAVDVAILCPGPSLREFIAEPGRHDVYIAVNRAAEAYACQYWAWLDAEAFDRFTPMGRPTCFTAVQQVRRVKDQDRLMRHAMITHEQVMPVTTCPSDPGWRHYTKHAAIVLADHLGATQITIYGNDMAGRADFTGAEDPPAFRGPYRWSNEAHKDGHVEQWLATRNVTIRQGRRVARSGFLLPAGPTFEGDQ